MDDQTIVAARRGNRDAQARLLRELQDPWYRLSLSLLRDPDRAQDATQESAVRFLRQLPGFRGESQLRTWALGIAINVVREIRRSQRPMVELEPESFLAPTDMWDPSPDASAELTERRDCLHASLADLPHRQREAVVLRFFEEMSVEQTAVAMQCAEGTVKATVHQALRTMRMKLKALV
ncbi:MAG TPA: RNA polymerase sigma factor [Tepidisphaeraceae bacterium]|nr:RNA polymerase sigma factor [Tepidisphaeraceae bacterium]